MHSEALQKEKNENFIVGTSPSDVHVPKARSSQVVVNDPQTGERYQALTLPHAFGLFIAFFRTATLATYFTHRTINNTSGLRRAASHGQPDPSLGPLPG